MNYCTTVNGLILSTELGHCQPHEHIYVDSTPASAINPLLQIDNLPLSIEEAKTYVNSGGRSIVDAQPFGAGRNVDALIEISNRAELHIIASTGFHLPHFYVHDHIVNTVSESRLYDIFMDEISLGMYATGLLNKLGSRSHAKAGIIKTAIGKEGLTLDVKRKLQAAARAASDSGLAILMHTEAGHDALMAVNLLDKFNVSPEKIVICHVDRQVDDYSMHIDLARIGVYLEYDTIGRFKYHSDEQEIELILHLMDKGFRDNLLISLDTTAGRLISYGGEIGLSYLINSFIPSMIRHGISKNDYEQMTRVNPAKVLSHP